MLQLLLGQIPEAIFFALFMIYAKNLKEKRVLFILLMVVEYLLAKYSFKFNFMFHITYMFLVYLTLKFIYKEKSQITDVFTLMIAYIIIIVFSGISFFIAYYTIKNIIITNIVCKILLFAFIFLTRKKLYNITNIYKKLWNRNDKISKKIKTTTFRAINIVIFNIMFYVINIGMTICLLIRK